MMGSPTRESAQWRGSMPSTMRCGSTPGTPRTARACVSREYEKGRKLFSSRSRLAQHNALCLIMAECAASAPPNITSGSSMAHFHSLPTGLEWWRQQKTHLLAHASEGVASMHRWEAMP